VRAFLVGYLVPLVNCSCSDRKYFRFDVFLFVLACVAKVIRGGPVSSDLCQYCWASMSRYIFDFILGGISIDSISSNLNSWIRSNEPTLPPEFKFKIKIY
jgi:hypothetical protein